MRFGSDTHLKTLLGYALMIMITVSLNVAARKEQTRRITRLYEFDNCKDRSLRPYHFLQRKISVSGKNTYTLNAEGVCEKETKRIEQVVVNMTKCADRTKSNCEYLRKFEWKPSTMICPLFNVRGAPWDRVLEAFSPRIGCVNHKGTFTVKNLTMDFEAMKGLEVGGGDIYVTSFEFFDEGNLPWLCFTTETDNAGVRA